MNALGVPAFYGSVEEETAISEVRPPVGCKVATAAFNITRPLQLLDLRVLRKARGDVSVFSPEYKEVMEKSAFLSQLTNLITRPVMPGDEAQEYLPTQAVADYLASRTDIIFDGIIFPSVQVNGKDKTNIVLFNKSSRVETIIHPNGIEVEIFDEDCFEDEVYPSYRVVRKKSAKATRRGQVPKLPDPDSRIPALSIDLESINIHLIKGVKFTTDVHPVTWEDFDMDDYVNFNTDLAGTGGKPLPFGPSIDEKIF